MGEWIKNKSTGRRDKNSRHLRDPSSHISNSESCIHREEGYSNTRENGTPTNKKKIADYVKRAQ